MPTTAPAGASFSAQSTTRSKGSAPNCRTASKIQRRRTPVAASAPVRASSIASQ